MRLAWLNPKTDRYASIVVILVVIAGGLGYSAGNRMQPDRRQSDKRSGLIAPAGNTKTQIVYNHLFADSPTAASAEAWHSLFPPNGGFIRHPELAPNYSAIAVFHQLHCLQALYDLYYGTDTHSGAGAGSGGHSHGHGDSVVHTRHCFDYLRQSLMCHADTNLEPYDFKLEGVDGWGTKKCRDYSAVFQFAKDWGWSQ